uniref:protein-tyrosine-phosphatase n=1 Tax=Spongospora subterranea TaxID=70186 RepID=A0A0H5R7S9_9EUKA|eukprot:CRZ10188.1 hypothetical protein [Spongospora subterranea]
MMFSSPVFQAGSKSLIAKVGKTSPDPTPKKLTFRQRKPGSPPIRKIQNLCISSPASEVFLTPSPDALSSKLLLPILPTSKTTPFISCDTVAALLAGKYRHTISEYLILDCRYAYEHEGGRIPDAVPVNRHDALARLYSSLSLSPNPNLVIIFHCEFSQNRAPQTFHAFRTLDRESNNYPALSFPQMFIMEGGYCSFFEKHSVLCRPNSYVTMFDPTLKKLWRKEIIECRKSWSKKKPDSVPVRDSSSFKRFTFSSPIACSPPITVD